MRSLPLVALIASLILSGQSVDDWKEKNRLVNRFEGTGFPVNQSNPAVLNVVSFTAFKEDVDVQKPTELAIEFFAKSAVAESVIARELSPFHNYWMEALPPNGGWRAGWNQFTGWLTKDVLGPKAIPTRRLGVLVTLKSHDPAREYLAAAVLRRRESKPNQSLSEYRLHLTSSVDISGGSFQVVKGCGSAVDTARSIEGLIGSQHANFTFYLDFSLKAMPRGTWMVAVQLYPAAAGEKAPKKAPVTREYCFDHEPTLAAE